MAGHSKWANIRARKSVQDAKKGKIFTKLIREITVAARRGGIDPIHNPRLRDAVTKGLHANLKRDTIDNAIKRGSGEELELQMMELCYEGYGPAGVAVLVQCLTDNKNRTVSEVRHAFTKCGGHLGGTGSVGYLFAEKGQICFNPTIDEEKLLEAALECGALDLVSEQDEKIVYTSPQSFYLVKDFLEKRGFHSERSELFMEAETLVTLEKEEAQKLLHLVEMLEDLDDVQKVYTNAEFTPDVLALLNT